MTAPTTTANAPAVAPRPRSRLRVRIVVVAFAAVGFAALAWAAFVSPLPRLTYNPSDSVAVGWYRIEPFDPRTASLPRPLSVDSIVLVPLPDRAAMLAAQRGYLPTRVPLLKRVGAVAPQHVCIVAGQVRIDGVP
ncbi:peptidase, partial [Pseudomonas aeruginosa]|uniref:S26 family signal peptidase n=1 Tax=Pseudomonas aeruginosa TaxID=287 RepID=UPI0009A5BAAC